MGGGETVTKKTDGSPRLYFPIFAQSGEDVQEQYKNLPKLVVPSKITHLQGITVGTINASTVENRWFGISAGQEVAIRIVGIESDLDIGELSDFLHYNVLVQEIVDCLTLEENAKILQYQLLTPMLHLR